MSNTRKPLLIKPSDQAFDSKIRSDKIRRKVKFITEGKRKLNNEIKSQRLQTMSQCMDLEERADQVSEKKRRGNLRKNK